MMVFIYFFVFFIEFTEKILLRMTFTFNNTTKLQQKIWNTKTVCTLANFQEADNEKINEKRLALIPLW